MTDRQFIQNEVAKILDIPPRKILNWTEKSLVIPFQESTGPGSKRQYSYLNLIEFLLCDFLLERKKIGFQHVKNIMNELRRSGLLKSWTLDYESFYKKNLKQERGKDKIFNIPKENIGTLIIYYSREFDDVSISPLAIEDVVNFSEKERIKIIESISVDLVDLNKIKRFVDSKV